MRHRKPTRFWPLNWRLWTLLFFVTGGSCARSADVAILRADMDRFKQLSQEMWAAASCTMADRELFDRLRTECPPDSTTTCKTVQIYPALRRRGGLQALFHSQRFRESFYLPHDARRLPDYRQSRLEKLVKLGPLFDSTRFVVVARTDPSEPNKETEATLRSQVIIKLLAEQLAKLHDPGKEKDERMSEGTFTKHAIDKMIWRWRYDAGLKSEELDELDRPQVNIGEPQNINRGVWVFRVDC